MPLETSPEFLIHFLKIYRKKDSFYNESTIR